MGSRAGQGVRQCKQRQPMPLVKYQNRLADKCQLTAFAATPGKGEPHAAGTMQRLDPKHCAYTWPLFPAALPPPPTCITLSHAHPHHGGGRRPFAELVTQIVHHPRPLPD